VDLKGELLEMPRRRRLYLLVGVLRDMYLILLLVVHRWELAPLLEAICIRGRGVLDVVGSAEHRG